MRTYYASSHRVLSDGSIEIEGRWRGVTAIAVAMVLLLPIARRIPLAVLGLLALGVYLLVFPPRRRVLFDRDGRALRLSHAGLFGERWGRTIPFGDVRELAFEDASSWAGARRTAVIARIEGEDVYLVTMSDAADAGKIERRAKTLLGA